MDKFQELLTEAAQLKEAQLKNQRKNYESLPDYIKSGLNFSKKYELLRRQDYLIQMSISERLKKTGNELFKIQQYQEALSKYEESLGIFRYIIAKSYDNMKDEDLLYENYQLPETAKEYAGEYSNHLTALYLNICSCLTKLNKKEDAIHSADQALKINETAKGYYKKAQAYLQYINKEASDIKLGFYYLNKSYEISKDPSIVQQMHRIKKEIDEDREKEKKWFKFMFDKNSQEKREEGNVVQTAKKEQPKEETKTLKEGGARAKQLKNFQRQKGEQLQKEDVRLEKTKEKLSKFLDPELSEQQWLQLYQGEFIAKHGSKIYSIIQLYGYKEYLGEYKALLAQCLEFRKEEQFAKRKELYTKYFQWLKEHPIDKIAKYKERYGLQTKWINQQRKRMNNQMLPIQSKGPREENEIKPHNKIETELMPQPQMPLAKGPESDEPMPLLVQSNIKQNNVPQQDKPEQQTAAEDQPNPAEMSDQDSSKTVKLYSFIAALAIVLILKFVL